MKATLYKCDLTHDEKWLNENEILRIDLLIDRKMSPAGDMESEYDFYEVGFSGAAYTLAYITDKLLTREQVLKLNEYLKTQKYNVERHRIKNAKS